MHKISVIHIPWFTAKPEKQIEQLRSTIENLWNEIRRLEIADRSLCEQLQQRQDAYNQTLAERDAFSKAYTAAQLQLSALQARNDELNAELAESRAECAARCALLRKAISTSVIGPELRGEIETTTR